MQRARRLLSMVESRAETELPEVIAHTVADYEAQDTLTVDHSGAARDEAVAFVSFGEQILGRLLELTLRQSPRRF